MSIFAADLLVSWSEQQVNANEYNVVNQTSCVLSSLDLLRSTKESDSPKGYRL